jgi:cell division protein FtsI (penicillin-binding protein 3)
VQKKKLSSIVWKTNNARLVFIWLFLAVGLTGLGVRLFYLQVVTGGKLKALARERQTMQIRPFVPRRPIVDRRGELLAIDRPSYTLYAHPRNFRSSKQSVSLEDVARELAPILERPFGDILAELKKKDTGVQLARGLSKEARDRVAALKNDGLELIQATNDFSRIYPQSEMAAEILGYIDTERNAQAGVERSQTALLERQINFLTLGRTGSGGVLAEDVNIEQLRAEDLRLQLTIDLRLQQAARQALQARIKQYKAKRGTVIVMDAEDGAIRALVVEPTFDPNRYTTYPIERFKNWAISDLYEPGSTFKPINVAIALENGKIDPQTRLDDSGGVTIGSHTIRNADKRGHGALTPAQVLQYSSNVGMVKMMQKLEPQVYYDWLGKLELGQRTGIDLPAETRSYIKDRSQFVNSAIEPATASFGQGLSLTPLQLVTLSASLANGGKLVTPHVVAGLYDARGVRRDRPIRPTPRQVFSFKTAETVLSMMQTVVRTGGTGTAAAIPGYEIGGKTGTAQKVTTRGTYDPNAKIVSFVGILPVDRQHRYVVFAAVDEPQGIAFGGTVAAPIVREVMSAAIAIEAIAPSLDCTPATPTTPAKCQPKPKP